MLILGQKSCILGPTIFKIPQPNWHYVPYLFEVEDEVLCPLPIFDEFLLLELILLELLWFDEFFAKL